MGEFFKGCRRKAGCVTMAFAMAYAWYFGPQLYTDHANLPHWSLVMGLTMLSIYLLSSKPKKPPAEST